MKWDTPELMVLQSGAEAQARKQQDFEEAPAESCVVGVGCPGDPNVIIIGPS